MQLCKRANMWTVSMWHLRTVSCYAVAVDELLGGTAQDYSAHICDSIENLASAHAYVHDPDQKESKKLIISNIVNTVSLYSGFWWTACLSQLPNTSSINTPNTSSINTHSVLIGLSLSCCSPRIACRFVRKLMAVAFLPIIAVRPAFVTMEADALPKQNAVAYSTTTRTRGWMVIFHHVCGTSIQPPGERTTPSKVGTVVWTERSAAPTPIRTSCWLYWRRSRRQQTWRWHGLTQEHHLRDDDASTATWTGDNLWGEYRNGQTQLGLQSSFRTT